MTNINSQNHSTLTPVVTVPLGVPLGSNSGTASSQVGNSRLLSKETNTRAAGQSERTHSQRAGRGRIGGMQLAGIAEALSDRDRAILTDLAAHGFLSTRHIERLSFTAHNPSTGQRLSRRAMTRLDRLGLVQPLARRVGGVRAGSSARIWQLSSAGRRLVALDSIAKRPHEPSPRLLAHSLAVADIHIALRDLAAVNDSIDVEVAIESLAWRPYLGLGGDRRLLQPDLALILSGKDDEGAYEDRWFIEADCGTESIPTLLKKCQAYEDYRQSGIEQSEHDVFPRVLWVMQGTRASSRRDELTRRIAHMRLPESMFSVVAFEDIAAAILGHGASS